MKQAGLERDARGSVYTVPEEEGKGRLRVAVI